MPRDPARPEVEAPKKKPDKRKGGCPPARKPAAEIDERTYRWCRLDVKDFCQGNGRVAAKDVKPFHVTKRLDAHAGGETGRTCAARALKGAFCRADEQGVCAPTP